MRFTGAGCVDLRESKRLDWQSDVGIYLDAALFCTCSVLVAKIRWDATSLVARIRWPQPSQDVLYGFAALHWLCLACQSGRAMHD